MSKYTGSQCIVCQKLFDDGDDVVVCPQCGTPYHRSCYESRGKCINLPLHASGKSWQSEQDEKRRMLSGKECPVCHHRNPPEAETCSVCHFSLHPETENAGNAGTLHADRPEVLVSEDGQHYFNAMDPCCGMSPEEDFGGERLGDVAQFVRTNTLYYIPLFKRFREKGHKISLNLPCIFFPHLYFANRKMWLMTIVTILLGILFDIPAFLISLREVLSSPDMMEPLQEMYGENVAEMFQNVLPFLEGHLALFEQLNQVFFVADLAIHLLLCFLGNWLYFRFVLRKVRKVRQSGASPQTRKAILQADGGTCFWNMLGAVGIHFGVIIALYTVLVMAFV